MLRLVAAAFAVPSIGIVHACLSNNYFEAATHACMLGLVTLSFYGFGIKNRTFTAVKQGLVIAFFGFAIATTYVADQRMGMLVMTVCAMLVIPVWVLSKKWKRPDDDAGITPNTIISGYLVVVYLIWYIGR